VSDFTRIYSKILGEEIGILPDRPDRLVEEREFKDQFPGVIPYHEGEIRMLEKICADMPLEDKEKLLRAAHRLKKIFSGYVVNPEILKKKREKERLRIALGIKVKYSKGWSRGTYPNLRYPGTLRKTVDSIELKEWEEDKAPHSDPGQAG
jgi:hypothetical protein